MRRGLDMAKIARALGAARQGKVSATEGISALCNFWPTSKPVSACPREAATPRTRVGPSVVWSRWHRGRARLEELAARIRQQSQVAIEPMQLAGLLLEKTTEQVSDAEVEKLLQPRSARR